MSEPSSDESSDENGPPAKKVKIDSVFLPNDVILIVEDQRLHVNRDLLVSASPVFEAWLKKEWQGDKQTESGKVELSFPGKSLKDMTTFLKCLMPSFSDKVTVDTIDAVLPLADEYQTEALMSECFRVIGGHTYSAYTTRGDHISPSQIVKYLQWFAQYEPNIDDKNIKTNLIFVAACEKTQTLEAVKGFDNIGEGLRYEIANKRTELLEAVFLSRLSDIEEAIHPKTEFGEAYSVEGYFLLKRNGSVRKLLENVLDEIKDLGKLSNTNNASMRKLMLCLSISESLELQSIYYTCIKNLSCLTREQFKSHWTSIYRTGINAYNKTLKKHLDNVFEKEDMFTYGKYRFGHSYLSSGEVD